MSVDGIASEMGIDAKAGAALRAITAIATGQAKQWTNVTHRTKHSDKYWCEIVVDWPLEVNEGSVFFDATARQAYLEYWTGKSINLPKLTARPRPTHPIIQFVDHDVSRCGNQKPLRDEEGKPIKGKYRGWEGQSPSHAAKIISAILRENPKAQKLGIITHQDTLKALMGDDSDPGLLPKHVTDRIAKTTHFGSGEDRASNEWTQRCDFLLVLGTARPSEDQVRRFLVSIGKTEAAGRQPEWCQQTWTATDGQALAIDRKGYYDDPDWEDAYQYLLQSSALQCIGRARAHSEHGIPCAIVSPEIIEDGRYGIRYARLGDLPKSGRQYAGRPTAESVLTDLFLAVESDGSHDVPDSLLDTYRESGTFSAAMLIEHLGQHGIASKTCRNSISGHPWMAKTDRRGQWRLLTPGERSDAVNAQLQACEPSEPAHDPSELAAERVAIAEESGTPQEHAEHLAAQQCPELSSDVITQAPDPSPDESLDQLAATPPAEAPEPPDVDEPSPPQRGNIWADYTPQEIAEMYMSRVRARKLRFQEAQSQLLLDATQCRGGPTTETLACKEAD